MRSHHVPVPFARTALARAAAGVLLAAGLLAGVPAGAPAEPGDPGDPGKTEGDRAGIVHPEVEAALQRAPRGAEPTVRVIVSLDVAGKVPQPSEVRATRAAVLEGLPASSYDVVARFDRIAAVSLEVDQSGLDALAADPLVTAVSKDHVVRLQMDQANAITGADDVHTSGITGAGTRVAIIDSGVDTDHPGLVDDLVAHRCFRTENDCPGGATSGEDQGGHGTHVAGIVTGPDGAAPDAQFYALKVFTTGDTSDTNILNALNHVINLNTATPGTVDLVNMSLGGGNFGSQTACDNANPGYVNAFASLNNQGTTVFVATGNSAQTNAVSSPGCVSGAVGVGSTGDGTHTIVFGNCTDNGQVDKVSCYSNTTPVQGAGELVDVLAPGCNITSTWLAGGTHTICGTSMASPYAAGVAALLLEKAADENVTLAPADVESILEETGAQVSDYRLMGGPTYPRVDALAAVGWFLVDRPDPPTSLTLTPVDADTQALSWTDTNGDETSVELQRRRLNGSFATVQIFSGEGTNHSHEDSVTGCGLVFYRVIVFKGTTPSLPSPVAKRSICAPGNDNRSAAKAVTVGLHGTSHSETESAVSYATEEAADPEFSCRFSGQGKGFQGIWYRIQPTHDVRVTISTQATTLPVPASSNQPDTILAVYAGTPSLANEQACNDDINSQNNFRSQVITDLAGGGDYFVHVAQWGSVTEGTVGNVGTQFSWSVLGLPDARIKKGLTGTLVGDDIYGTATGQTRSATVARGKKVTFVASLQNDAGVTDVLDVLGGAGSSAITVTYKDPLGTNITSQVVAGTFDTPSLAPGETFELTVVARVKSTARAGAKISRMVKATSQAAPASDDFVVFKVARK